MEIDAGKERRTGETRGGAGAGERGGSGGAVVYDDRVHFCTKNQHELRLHWSALNVQRSAASRQAADKRDVSAT